MKCLENTVKFSFPKKNWNFTSYWQRLGSKTYLSRDLVSYLVSIYTCTAGRAGCAQGAQYYTVLNTGNPTYLRIIYILRARSTTGNPSKKDANIIFIELFSSLKMNGWAACGRTSHATDYATVVRLFHSPRSAVALSRIGDCNGTMPKGILGPIILDPWCLAKRKTGIPTTINTVEVSTGSPKQTCIYYGMRHQHEPTTDKISN